MNKIYTLFVALLLISFGISAQQIVTTTPTLLQESSQNVVLTYNAASPLGNKGLANLPQSTDVYAHIGVITSKSGSSSDWRYVVTEWPNTGNQQQANTSKNRLKYVSANTYSLAIGDIRSYFGITDAAERVKQIAVVFRNGDGSRQGKTASGGDIFIAVEPDGFALGMVSDHPDRIISGETTVKYTLEASQAADLLLSVNGVEFAAQKNATSLSASYRFSEAGRYTVTGTALYGGETYTQTAEIVWPKPAQAEDYPGGIPQMGAVKNGSGDVVFCLAAPGKKCVQLIGAWNGYAVEDRYDMKYQDYNGDRYFWTTVSGLKDDVYYPYFYLVDEQYRVADPYGHIILDCYNDKYLDPGIWPDGPKHPGEPFGNVMMACYRGDLDNYTFSDFTIPDHDNLVVYEMLLRDFTGTDGTANGNGTVRQAIAKIPYIKEMGFNAVELMPIMEFNGNNSWGYNTNFYMAPDKAYGSPADYRDFVEECHRNGIAVILDIVFNQSDGLHPWYAMYPSGESPLYNKVAPHQWSVLNDWNQGKTLVQQQWTDALKYWMEKYNVDGYRFDLVKGLGDNESYAQAGGTDQYNENRLNHMIRFHDVIRSVKPDGIHINEFLGGTREEIAMGNDGQIQWANVNNASCQFAMGWDDGDNNLLRFLSTNDGGRPWGSTVSYAESHDEQRMGYKCIAYGQSAVKADARVRYNRLAQLAVQMLLTPGPKMVWQFGEFGDSQNAKSANGDNNTDPKVVNWSGWMADADRMFLHDTYASIINLRMSNPELMKQSATFESSGLNSRFTTPRSIRLTAGNKEVVAFINPSWSGNAVNIKSTGTKLTPSNGKLICASAGFVPQLSGTDRAEVSVPANGFAVYATEDVSGIDNVPAGVPAAAVTGGKGEIIISGDYTSVEVYDLSGRQMPGLTVPAGLYIVRVDGTAHKVVVK